MQTPTVKLWWILELMRHAKPVRLKTAPTGWGPNAVESRTYRVGLNAGRLENRTYPDNLTVESAAEMIPYLHTRHFSSTKIAKKSSQANRLAAQCYII